MARPKKNGKRALGIQGKNGYLYVVTSQLVINDGVKKSEKIWHAITKATTSSNMLMGRFFIRIIRQSCLQNLSRRCLSYLRTSPSTAFEVPAYQFWSIRAWM